jgi:hypothetical protein
MRLGFIAVFVEDQDHPRDVHPPDARLAVLRAAALSAALGFCSFSTER